MVNRIIAVAVLGVALAGMPAYAIDKPQQDPKALLEDATRTMVQALGLLIKSIPQYEAPVVLDNGDILIRRKHSDDAPSKPTETPDDEADQRPI